MKNTFKNTIQVRPAAERGHANHGWLDSYHTFSFANYYDEKYMGFRSLRVINDDWIAPGKGFGAHPHRDMEIFTYVIEGAVAHKDSMGHESVIKAGDVQKITAGTGIVHSEYNGSQKEKVHLLQIWIVPAKQNLKPFYQEFRLGSVDSKTPVSLIGSPQGGENVMQFNQDVYIYKGALKSGESYQHDLKSGRGVWLQMIKGEVQVNGVNGQKLVEGDGAAVENVNQIAVAVKKDAEFLLMDLA